MLQNGKLGSAKLGMAIVGFIVGERVVLAVIAIMIIKQDTAAEKMDMAVMVIVLNLRLSIFMINHTICALVVTRVSTLNCEIFNGIVNIQWTPQKLNIFRFFGRKIFV